MASPAAASLPQGWRAWLAGARPRTLPAAVVPVLVGTACAVGEVDVSAWRALAAGIVALFLQIGTNYANDYSDGVRGTDDPGRRVGPVRLVGWGLQPPRAVKRAALLSFAVAGIAGLAIAVAVGPEVLVVGAAAMAAGWFYTGGSHPYGYYGLGEVFVFVFFGVVATVGSTYVQIESVTALSAVASVPVGLLATALLVINNLRDIPGDTLSGKRTLAVRLGDARTRWLYVGMLVAAFAVHPGGGRRVRSSGRRRRARRDRAGPPARAEGARGSVRTRAHPRVGRDGPGAARDGGAPRRRALDQRLSGSSQRPWSASQGRIAARKRSGCSRWAA